MISFHGRKNQILIDIHDFSIYIKIILSKELVILIIE